MSDNYYQSSGYDQSQFQFNDEQQHSVAAQSGLWDGSSPLTTNDQNGMPGAAGVGRVDPYASAGRVQDSCLMQSVNYDAGYAPPHSQGVPSYQSHRYGAGAAEDWGQHPQARPTLIGPTQPSTLKPCRSSPSRHARRPFWCLLTYLGFHYLLP